MSFIMAQICGLIAFSFSVIAMQINNKKKILYCITMMGVFYTANYIFLKAYSGAIVCGISTVETIINSIFTNKGKNLPKVLIGLYVVIACVAAFYTYNKWVDFFSIAGSFIGIGLICVKKEKNIRKCNLANKIVWCIYDLITGSIVTAVTDVIGATSTIIGIYRFDIKKEGEKISHENDA